MKRRPRQSPHRPHVLIALALAVSSNRMFLRGISHFIHTKANWHVSFVDVQDLLDGLSADKIEQPVDAVIAREDALTALRKLLGRDMPPAAVFGNPDKGSRKPDTYYFSLGGANVGRVAARYFLRLGNFASYGYCADDKRQSFEWIREEGFRAELAQRGKPLSLCPNLQDRTAVLDWIKSLPKPLAVFCAYDPLAVAFLDICAGGQIRVPQDVSVLGVDNDDGIGLIASPPLSSIQLQNEDLGYAAAATIDRRLLSGKPVTGFSCVKDGAKVIERDSSATPVPAVHLINNAREYIAQNTLRKISVNEVALHLGISRQLLELRFREIAHTTVKATILKARLESVCRMLVQTDKTITSVSRSCGFSNLSGLKTTFRRCFGKTMSEYRSQAQIGHTTHSPCLTQFPGKCPSHE